MSTGGEDQKRVRDGACWGWGLESSILKRDQGYLGHVIIGHSREDGEGGRGNSQCKIPIIGTCLAYSGDSNEWLKENEKGRERRESVRTQKMVRDSISLLCH